MRGLLRSAAGLAIVMVTTVVPVSAQEAVPAGHVKTVSGTAMIVRAHGAVHGKAGRSDLCHRHAPDGGRWPLGVTLKDDTRVSLGPSSEVRVDRFVYAPGEGGSALVLKVVRGVAAYVSGTDRQARARLDPPRNAGGDRRRARHDPRHSRRPSRMMARPRGRWLHAQRGLLAALAACVRRRRRSQPPERTANRSSCCCPTGHRHRRPRIGLERRRDDRSRGRRESTIATAGQARSMASVMSEADVQRLFGDALSALPPAPSTSPCTSSSSPTS